VSGALASGGPIDAGAEFCTSSSHDRTRAATSGASQIATFGVLEAPMSGWLYRTAHRIPPSIGIALVVVVLSSIGLHAQSPWERAAFNLESTFTGPLARSLALVAIVIGGLMFMFGEGGAKRQISGIVFGGGLALFAGQFLTWLF
jgi:type IV secretory pathway VirB2 component (pilin)